MYLYLIYEKDFFVNSLLILLWVCSNFSSGLYICRSKVEIEISWKDFYNHCFQKCHMATDRYLTQLWKRHVIFPMDLHHYLVSTGIVSQWLWITNFISILVEFITNVQIIDKWSGTNGNSYCYDTWNSLSSMKEIFKRMQSKIRF